MRGMWVISKLRNIFAKKIWLVICTDTNPAECVAELHYKPSRDEFKSIVEDYDGTRFALVEQKGDDQKIIMTHRRRERKKTREAEEIPKELAREEITQRIRQQIEKVKAETNKLKKLKAEFENMFGEDPIGTDLKSPIEGIMKGIAEGAYKGLRKREDEIAESVVGTLKGISACLQGLGTFLAHMAGESKIKVRTKKKEESREETEETKKETREEPKPETQPEPEKTVEETESEEPEIITFDLEE